MMNNIEKWSAAVFWLFLCALYSFWAWTPQLNDFGGDSAIYLLTAQHWSFFGGTNPAAGQFAASTTYPPLYPLLLALFSAGRAWLLAHQITALCGVAALFVFWRCLRVAGLPFIDSLIAIALIALVPGVYLQALFIHSEFLFLLFVSICLYAVFRLEQKGSVNLVALASLAAAGAFLTRTVGLSLVVALGVYLLLHRTRRELVIYLVLAVAPVWAWMQFGQSVGGGYLATWTERLGIVGSPTIASMLASQSAALIDGFRENIVGQRPTNIVAFLLLSAGCIVAWVLRLSQGKLDALFLGAYFAILLAWPFPAERVRFILPAVPIAIVQLFLALHAWTTARFPKGGNIGTRLAIILLGVTIAPSLILTAERFMEPMPSEMEGYRRSAQWYGWGDREARLTAIYQYRRLQTGFEELRDYVARDECVYSIKPSLVGLFAERNSYRSPLPNSSLGKQLDASRVQCRYVHMLAFSSPTFPDGFYPLATWADRMDIIHATHLIESDQTSTALVLLGKIRGKPLDKIEGVSIK